MYSLKNIEVINFRNIEHQIISFWKNKTVFVGKNGSGKTILLKTIEKLLNSKKIKPRDFKDPKKNLSLKVRVHSDKTDFEVFLEAKLQNKKVELSTNFEEKEVNTFLQKLNLIYIPSDRKINNIKENGYTKLIDLILNTKESKKLTLAYKAKQKLKTLKWKPGRLRTTILVSLLRLYMDTLSFTKNDDFNIFLIDQPENFLHPHATKVIDDTLGKIWELESTQVFYTTHSPALVSNFKKWKYEIDDIVFVKNTDEKGTIAHKIENSNGRFDKIMINLIFKNADIFFSDAVILVEWETEKISIPNIYENTNLLPYCEKICYNLSKRQREEFFNLHTKNISVIDVWGKWALYDWYIFASELFWKEKVVAMIDKDNNYAIDRDMIIKSIKYVYKINKVYETEFEKYNWFVLNGEFEDYYKVDIIKNYLEKTITERAHNFWEKFDPTKLRDSILRLEKKLTKLHNAKKISHIYENLFSSYFRKYSKPTIAFNLSVWLCENNGYKEELLKIFSRMIIKLTQKK